MEIKQLQNKDKIITFFGEIKSSTVEKAIEDIVGINIEDLDYIEKCRKWALENNQSPTPATLSPILFYLSTGGGTCYDGMALHDVIEASPTPIEVICTGKIMSMGVVVALGAKVRKAYRNTTFMIHQVQGLSIGSLREMEDTVAEVSRINDMLFRIIKEKTSITEAQLNDVVQNRRDWFMTADEALKLGIITEIIA
ncbi:MAG: ATP-dependent Clp protease proteolytic subunit [Bacteroidales bacterium]|nr:ATP-dependent Clp protease proteolytic subunit [Bacteroidales bacterium]